MGINNVNVEKQHDAEMMVVVKYIFDTYQRLSRTTTVVKNDEFIIEQIILPKYCEELEKKITPPPLTAVSSKLTFSRTKTIADKPPPMKKADPPVKPEKPIKTENNKKKAIPLTLKRNVWNKYIGETVGKTLCLCCKLTDITQMNFSCGHIISANNGGEVKLDNLRPICVSCNSSMGTKNMDDFIAEYGL
jgi:hypothetical protein